MLEEAVRQCGVWRRLGIDLGLTVNATVLDLLEPRYAAGVEATLRKLEFPASALTIEITEGAFVQEPARVRRTLETLRGLGIQIAIDDFGTGYSSLGYLKELPVDLLKIDRSFVSDLPGSDASAAIVAAAIELSHRLGLGVVAEGVETPVQYEFLAELGCDSDPGVRRLEAGLGLGSRRVHRSGLRSANDRPPETSGRLCELDKRAL